MKHPNILNFLLVICACMAFCCNRPHVVIKHGGEKDLISFKSIQGITYTEVARRLNNGLSFNEYGYHLEPQWKMSFISNDSARIYSPIKNQLINFPLSRGYDSIFNTARTWLKAKKMNKDSLVLEILKFQGDSISVNGAKVYMILYADNYIKNVLHTTADNLMKATRRDTQFVARLVARANSDYTKAFAARQPVQLISKSALIEVKQRKSTPDMLNNFDTSDDYLDPTFDITIHKAYKNFYYTFSVYVDEKGGMHYRIPLVDFSTSPEFKPAYIRVSQGIMNSYIKLYCNTIPGKTLGMNHSSIITLNITGEPSAK